MILFQPKLAEKLERLRWCITEGLGDQYKITGLKPVTSATPFGTPPASLMPAAPYGVNDFRPAGANYQSKSAKGRGASSKRPVLASGGTLEVLAAFRFFLHSRFLVSISLISHLNIFLEKMKETQLIG